MTSHIVDAEIGELHIAGVRKEIVFIEDDIADIGTLLGGIGRDKEVVILDASVDGLHQIAQALAGKSGIDALHIFSHGEAGAARLGSLILDSAHLDAYRNDLLAIRQGMSADGDILLYGCNIGAGGGAGFVERLAIATGADVAASSDMTGAAAFGGNWNLEVASGEIGTAVAVDAQTAALYQGVLNISPGTIEFGINGNFVSGLDPDSAAQVAAGTDVIYRVNGDANYQLRVDGASTAVSSYSDPASQLFAGVYRPETAVTFSFVGGKVFTATDIALSNWSISGANTVQDLVIKGYDTAGHQVGGTVTTTLSPSPSYLATSISLAALGSTPIATLTIKPASGTIDYMMIDSISISSIAPPPPQVVYVTSPSANRAYKAGDQIDIQVNFDDAVDVSGTPQLTLETGATDRVINYLAGSGSSILTFRYTVQPGDTTADLDYRSTSLALNGGTIKAHGSTTIDATLTLPTPGTSGSLGLNKNIVIDTTAPNAPSAPDLSGAGDSGSSTTDNITNRTTGLIFSGATEAGVTAVKLYDSDGVTEIAGTSSISGATYTITTTGALSNGAHTLTTRALDAAGNVSSASASLLVTVDNVAPAVSVASSQSVLKAGEAAILTFTFTEDPGASFTTADVSYNGGALGAISGSGLTRTASFTPDANVNSGSAGISVNNLSYADTAGNGGAGSATATLTYDTLAPTLTISSSTQNLKIGETAVITFSFSEDPGASFSWDGASGDLAVSGGTLSALSGSGTTRTATFTPTANVDNGSAGVSVIANSYADAAGNLGSAGASPAISYDTLAPTLAITSSKPALAAGETATITFSFSEDPGASFSWNGTSGSITVSGGTLSAISGSGATRTATFTPTAGVDSGAAGISVSSGQYFDAKGNPGSAAPTPSITYDTLAPAAPSAPDLVASDDSGGDHGDKLTNVNAPLTFSGTAGAGTTVKLYDGAAEIGSGTADGGNNWVITTGAALAAGLHTLTARAFDAAGNASGASGSLAVTVDRVPPAVSISSDKSVLKAGDTALITFTFTEDPGGSFGWDGSAGDLAVSGGTLSAVSGSGTTRSATFTPDAGVDAGTASITVTGPFEDAAGNAGTSGATPSISFDTLAPHAPSAPDLEGSDDSGSASADDVTNALTTTFSGTADAGATVRLYDGAAEIGSIAASGGNWFIPMINLGEGSHTLTARAFDAAGNASAASGALNLVVDRTPPATGVGTARLSEDTGASSTDMITANGTQTISGTLGANLAAGEQVMVSTNNGATWTAATASAGTNTWELATTLGGSGILQVRVVDAAGNAGTPWTHAYTVDTTAPPAPSTPDLDTAADSGSSHTDDITGVTLPAFSGTAEIGATVRLYDGAIEIGHDVAAGDGSWHITTGSGTPLAQGSHSITAQATDLAGNTDGASPPLTVWVITSATSTGIAGMALSSDSGAAGDFITNEETQTISGTLNSALAAGERVQFSLDGGAHWTDAAGAAGSSAWSFPATLAQGTHDIQVRVLDAVDNPGPVHVQAYTLDSVRPAVTIASDVAQLKAGETAGMTFTFSEDPGTSFSWDGSAGDVTVGGGTLSALSGSGLVRTAIFTPAADTNGGTASITVTGAYEDAAGNEGTAGVTPTLHFDTLVPAAASTPDLEQDSDSGASNSDNLTHDTTLVFSGTAEAGATVRLYDGAAEIGHVTAGGGTYSIAITDLGEGSHALTARVFDAAGNPGAASGTLTVTVDTARPAAMAAPALATGSDSGIIGDGITRALMPTWKGNAEAFAQVTLYDGATALGSVSADAQGVWEFAPAAALPDGVHAITARQVDGAGNQSDAGAVFNLTVDTVAPAAPGTPVLQAASDTGILGDGITEDDRPVIEGTALANTLVTLYDTAGNGKVKVGTALADGTGKWSIQTAGLDDGIHALSATQQDAAGNESAASAAFLLRIDEPPAPLNLVDGVAVDIHPISLPGGVNGTAVSIPIVSFGRVESSGKAGVADIPLAISNTGDTGASLLLAQVAPGYGLSAFGAVVPAANAVDLLLAAIRAATPAHAASDQGHLTGDGASFLHAMGSGGSLLVETVKPVSGVAPAGVLTLSGQHAGMGHSTALVIDASGLGAGAAIVLQQVDFAAVIGAASVVSNDSMMLSGDAASQHFTIVPGAAATTIIAGGGDDTITLAPSAGFGSMLLHGGSASDVAVFSGARADYRLEFHNGYVAVYGASGPAAAIAVNVEQLKFSDTSVAVQNSTDMSTLAGIYQTVLGRQADMTGIEFWADARQAGASWGGIALEIIGSPERTASHEGFNGVAVHDITMLYTALFNRAPDAEGLAFWTAAMEHGVSLEHIAGEFVQSVEMVGHQRAALDWDFIVG